MMNALLSWVLHYREVPNVFLDWTFLIWRIFRHKKKVSFETARDADSSSSSSVDVTQNSVEDDIEPQPRQR